MSTFLLQNGYVHRPHLHEYEDLNEREHLSEYKHLNENQQI
jgi:hypothetical protein